MRKSEQILEVTYGTFSCRLEGFEDSVETMKAVVQYFHELAGHDRFMDLEPQAPDLDELARLTEEQTGEAAEAIEDEGRVSLRALTPGGLSEDASDDLAETVIADGSEDASAHPDHDADAYEFDNTGEDDAELDDQDDLDDGCDDDGSEDWGPEKTEDDAVEMTADHLEEDDDPAELENPASEADEYEAEEALADTSHEETFEDAGDEEDNTDDEPVVDEAELSQPEELTFDESDMAALQAAPADEDSVAAKLQRIRAVVGRTPPPSHQPSYSEDLTEAPQKIVDTFDFDDGDDDDDDDTPLVLSDSLSTDPVDEPVSETDENDLEGADVDPDEPSGEMARRRDNRSKRDSLPENDDDAMSRIMSQTDERLNEPEGRRHRDAFAQLKAAVAATEAARQLGDSTKPKDPADAFRGDFEDAVGKDDRNEPLTLGEAQRVEGDESLLDQTAHRLRKIAAVKEGASKKPSDFSQFAADQGATELIDLLEAAAAYIAFVEGDNDFSRPQVMKKVQMATRDEFSREDGLRSFGRLLRQSKIIKLNNGRFQVADDTRFRPDNQAAQG